MIVNINLEKYIQTNILPRYDNNYIGDGVDRVEYVINRADEIIAENNLKINADILYTAICYHDIRFDNEEEKHEIKSAEFMYNDDFLNEYFNQEELVIIKEAIEDKNSFVGI